MTDLRAIATPASFILGAVALISGIGHWVAVTITAFSERGGYDARLGMLLVIGILPVACGAAMMVGANVASDRPSLGLGIIALASSLFALVLVALWPGLTKGPGGSTVGTAIGIVAFGAEAVVAWFAR